MGPEATGYFFDLIIKNTEARCDQDHVPVLIWNNPRIPPRTDAIFRKGKSPLPLLEEGVKILCRAGADLIVMPCITAHHFWPRVSSRERFDFVDLIAETRLYVRKNLPGLRRLGLIASSGTIRAKLFPKAFAADGICIINPEPREQRRVMTAIFGPRGIKAGFTTGGPRRTIQTIARKLVARGAEAIIAGCTEVPLVLKEEDLPFPLVDPLRIAARACIARAGYKIRK
jgi:aspartate racemase